MQFFDDLPSGRTVREEAVDWAKVKADLMENPGRWGLMAENISSSTPGQLRAGKNRHFRGPELAHFEFRVRKPKDPKEPYGRRRTDLYGRYTVKAGKGKK